MTGQVEPNPEKDPSRSCGSALVELFAADAPRR